MTAARLARGLFALTLALVAVAVVLGTQSQGVVAADEQLFPLFALPATAFSAVGALIVTRRSGQRVGWLCLAIGVLFGAVIASSAAGLWALRTGAVSRPAGEWLGWAAFLWVPATGLIGTHLALRLPDGHLPTPRWRPYARLCTAVLAFATVTTAAAPATFSGVAGNVNPTSVPALHPLVAVVGVVFPLTFVGGIASVVVRYRRAAALERLQLRSIAFGVAIFAVSLASSFLVDPVPVLGALVPIAGSITMTAIPAGIGVAVLRYRLYDIDRVISRTLSYTMLTVLLAATYAGVVAVLRQLLSPLTGDSQLAVAGSTLAVAALFMPARWRVQALVDRRFNRARYDAAQIVEDFSARLRDQVDLDDLTAELLAAVHATVEPARASLWLRDDEPVEHI